MDRDSHQGSYIVARSYDAAYPDALTAREGERLTVTEKASHWPGWIWCAAPSGKSGWVPRSWVTLEKDGTCIMRRDYSGTELSVQEGEEVMVASVESGWAWATNRSGHSGWIPADHLAHT